MTYPMTKATKKRYQTLEDSKGLIGEDNVEDVKWDLETREQNWLLRWDYEKCASLWCCLLENETITQDKNVLLEYVKQA